jgi:hypothetical protein
MGGLEISGAIYSKFAQNALGEGSLFPLFYIFGSDFAGLADKVVVGDQETLSLTTLQN